MSGCHGRCNQGRSCDCVDTLLQARISKAKAEYEAGNFYPDTPEEIPLTPWEAIAIYGAIALGAVLSLAIMAGATGWIYQTFFN